MVDAPISGAPTPTIAVFAHDAGESTVVKRGDVVPGVRRPCHWVHVSSRTARQRSKPRMENVDFGSTVDRNYLARLPKLIIAIVRMIGRRCDIRRCAFIYARNIDMLTVALAAKWLSGTSAPVAYEVLDVQRVFTDKGLVGAIFRWAERVLLRRCDLLVVSSPMFITKYFEPIQAYTGSWYLLENKISEFQIPVAGQSLRPNRKAGPPWIIGWFGTLRCARSLKILSDLAEAFRTRWSFTFAGVRQRRTFRKRGCLPRPPDERTSATSAHIAVPKISATFTERFISRGPLIFWMQGRTPIASSEQALRGRTL